MDFILVIPLAFVRPRAEDYIFFYNNMVFLLLFKDLDN